MSIRARVATAAVGFLVLAGETLAAGSWWPTVLVSDPPAGHQVLGDGIALHPTGDFTVVWADEQQGIMLRRMSAGGIAYGPAIAINTDKTWDTSQLNPAIRSDHSGRFVVAWARRPSGSESVSIQTRRFRPWGAPEGTETTVTSSATAFTSAPRLAMNAAGDYVVAWWQGELAHARMFDASGTAIGGEFTIPNLGQTGHMALTDSRTVVAATMTTAGATLQCYTQAGATGPAATVPLGVGAEAYSQDGELDLGLAVSQGSRIALSWSERNPLLNTLQLRYLDSDCATVLWSAEVDGSPVIGGPAPQGYVVDRARLAASPDQDQIGISWISSAGGRDSVHVRTYDVAGTALDQKQTLGPDTYPSFTLPPSIAISAAGEITAAWSSLQFDGTGSNVYASGTGSGGPIDNGTRDLAITLQANPDGRVIGGRVGYTADVTNNSHFTATAVTVEITLPEGFQATGGGQGCYGYGNPVVCQLDSLQPMSTRQITVDALASNTAGTYTTIAEVNAAEPDPEASDNRSELTSSITDAAADLMVYNFGAGGLMGEAVTWRVDVYNLASTSDATGITVDLEFPEALQFDAVESPDWSCIPAAGSASCRTEAALPVHAGLSLLVRMRTPADLPREYPVTARVSSDLFDPAPANNSDARSISTQSPPHDLGVSFDIEPSVIAPGTDTVVTVTVMNHALGSAWSLPSVEFRQPDGFTVKSVSAPGWNCGTLGSCQYPGWVRGGESVSYQVTLTAPHSIGKFPISVILHTGGNDLDQENNYASGEIEVAVCGISSTSSEPKPQYKLKTNNGVDFRFHMGGDGVCDVRVK